MTAGEVTLNIQVDVEGHRRLQSMGERIALVRVMAGDPQVVVVVVFDPFGFSTAIGFFGLWQVFVSQGPVQPLREVNMQVLVSIEPGAVLTFDGTGFGYSGPAFDPAVFGVTNGAGDVPLCCGLAQRLIVGNMELLTPIHIADFPRNTTAYFEPTDEVRIFLVRGVSSGEILPASILWPIHAGGGVFPVRGLPTLVGGYLSVPLSGDTTIHYDAERNCFLPGPLSVGLVNFKNYIMSLDWSNVKQLQPPLQTNNTDVILSGHGALDGLGATLVPAGMELWVLAPPGASIADETGQALENMTRLTQLGIKNPGSDVLVNDTPAVYKAGMEVPDYTLYPPRGIVIDPHGPHVIGVEAATKLSALWVRVQPFVVKGKTLRVFWAACTVMAGAKNPVVIGR